MDITIRDSTVGVQLLDVPFSTMGSKSEDVTSEGISQDDNGSNPVSAALGKARRCSAERSEGALADNTLSSLRVLRDPSNVRDIFSC